MPRPVPPPSLPGRLRTNGMMAGGGVLLALLVAVAVAAPWLAPAPPNLQFDPVAGRYLPPGAERVPLVFGDGRRLLAEAVQRQGDRVVAQRLGRTETHSAETLANLPATGVPEPLSFPLGTDRFGRDVLSRLIHGARVSLSVAVLSVLVALTLGVLVGSMAAVGGGWIDQVLMRLVDAVLAIPRIFLLLAVVAFFRPGTAALVLVIGATTWMTVARLVRAEMLSLQGREFVLAARATGAHPLRVLRVHLLPNAMTPVLVVGGLMVGAVILLESALSFLGLGVQPPTPSWGNMIGEGTDRLLGAWWVPTFPGLAIVLTVVAVNLLSDGLRDALDPRS